MSEAVLYLWPRRTVHVGRLDRPIQFSQASASLMVSLDGPLRVSTSGTEGSVTCTSLLLRPGEKADIDSGEGRVGTCYLDALGQDYALLLSEMTASQSGFHCGFSRDKELAELFETMLVEEPDEVWSYQRLESLINPTGQDYPAVDARVATVVGLIRQSVAENRSVEELAQAVNLSVPRLVRLFRECVGVPIRRYRQWHRLFVTAINVAGGCSLTDAAIQAGFNDSAHFSHTFRTTLGLRPSDVLSELVKTRLVVADSLDKATGLAMPGAETCLMPEC